MVVELDRVPIVVFVPHRSLQPKPCSAAELLLLELSIVKRGDMRTRRLAFGSDEGHRPDPAEHRASHPPVQVHLTGARGRSAPLCRSARRPAVQVRLP